MRTTAIVSVTHVCYRNGAMNDIKAIVEAAHAKGVPVLVDAYQSTGAVPIDFEDLGADFLVGRSAQVHVEQSRCWIRTSKQCANI